MISYCTCCRRKFERPMPRKFCSRSCARKYMARRETPEQRRARTAKARAASPCRPPVPRRAEAALYELVGVDAEGNRVTGFVGAGTNKDAVSGYVPGMFCRTGVEAVEVWVSVGDQVTVTLRNPRRRLVETIRRERRAA